MNVGKDIFIKGSYGWSTCQLKIITGMYIKVNAVFLLIYVFSKKLYQISSTLHPQVKPFQVI